MSYNKYKAEHNRESFFKNWKEENLNLMSEEMKDFAYEKYLLKCRVFNRDSFTCQNENCKYCHNEKEFTKLTVHHIKHKRNGGEDKERNCVLICKASHNAFNRKKDVLKFGLTENIPPHIRGHTFRLHISEEINWKEVKQQVSILKKDIKLKVKSMNVGNNKQWFKLTMEQIIMLMKFLDKRYCDYNDEDE